MVSVNHLNAAIHLQTFTIMDIVQKLNRITICKYVWIFLSEEDESEMFQVKKTSHSKKVMKMMDKERRKKKAQSSSSSLSRGNSNERNIDQYNDQPNRTEDNDHRNSHTNRSSVSYDKDVIDTNTRTDDKHDSINKKRNKNSNSSIQTEIRTDDFVVRLLLSIFLPIRFLFL